MTNLHIPNLNAADARVAEFVFEFVQFLLDDDANLTPTGNLNAAARQRLRARIDEVMPPEEGGGHDLSVTLEDLGLSLDETEGL